MATGAGPQQEVVTGAGDVPHDGPQPPTAAVVGFILAWPRSHPRRSRKEEITPPDMPKPMVPMKKIHANDQPKRPADRNSSAGLVNGDATMNATTGAHGAEVANIPSTTAVVPQEQKGVAVASMTAPAMATGVRWRSQAAIRSVPTYTERADAARTLASR